MNKSKILNQPFKIYEKCYKMKEDNKICFHYTQMTNKYNVPELRYCIHRDDIVLLANTKEVEEQFGRCVFHFDLIPEELLEKIKTERPQIETPYHHLNTPQIKMFVLYQNNILLFLSDKLTDDCLTVYTRNSNTLEVLEVYYSKDDNVDSDMSFAGDIDFLSGCWVEEVPTDLMIITKDNIPNYCIQIIDIDKPRYIVSSYT